jgi:hypothetical protein
LNYDNIKIRREEQGEINMIGLIWRLLFGRFTSCEHVWETKISGQLTENGSDIGHYVVLRCKKCGDFKSRRFFA